MQKKTSVHFKPVESAMKASFAISGGDRSPEPQKCNIVVHKMKLQRNQFYWKINFSCYLSFLHKNNTQTTRKYFF